jgi:hypothetical protein
MTRGTGLVQRASVLVIRLALERLAQFVALDRERQTRE